MKTIAYLAMTGAITASQVETIKNAKPYQLAEIEELSNKLIQTSSKARLSYSDIINEQKVIDDYITEIDEWIQENIEDDEEEEDSSKKYRTCEGALVRLDDDQKSRDYEKFPRGTRLFEDKSYPADINMMFWAE